jgi:hypothetical protein
VGRRRLTNRLLAYTGIATALLLVGLLLRSRSPAPATPPGPERASPTAEQPGETAGPPQTSRPLRSPPSAVAELRVLTDRTEGALQPYVDRDALAKQVATDHLCGDDAACNAVEEVLRDERATHLQIASRADRGLDRIDLDAATAGLSVSTIKTLVRRDRLVVVHVATATSTLDARNLALRTALAAAAAIATRIDGLVYDPLLSRIESASDFAKHAPTEPWGASLFRADRIQLLSQPRSDDVVRVLTAGLARWGAPDVEAAAVPTAAGPRVAEIVLGVAAKVAAGLESGPVALTRAELARARGAAYPDDAGLPTDREVRVDLVPEQPETGDPNDFLARIEPPGGDGPMAYLELAESFFGSSLAASSEEDVVRARASKAQRALGAALARWSVRRSSGGELLVRLPFPIPGDAGVESMWVEVTGFDDRTVTGKLVDEPLGATDVAPGDTVTRPRTAVEDIQEHGGAAEAGSGAADGRR